MRKVHVCDLSPLVYGVVFAYGQYICIIITNNADNHSDNESDNDDDE